MKDKLLDSTINGISDSSKNRNSGKIIDFALSYAISEVSIKENLVKSFWSTVKEICKDAKRLGNIVTLIKNFSLILANEKHIKDVL